jgi:lysophospholipid acyltransferase (LPLAT)-like uncharacterized protein
MAPDFPDALRPLLATYARMGGFSLETALGYLASSCEFDERGDDADRAGRGCILCYWHGHAMSGLLWLKRRGRPVATLCHPAWHLVPYFDAGLRLKWPVVIGSSGHGGRAAADALVRELRAGSDTFVCPDGPAGPPRQLKRGVIHMARAADVPVVPVRFRYSAALRLPRWDGWRVPLPGSRIEVRCGAPIRVGQDDAAAARSIAEALGGSPPPGGPGGSHT